MINKKSQRTLFDDISKGLGRTEYSYQLPLVKQPVKDIHNPLGFRGTKPQWDTEVNPIDYEERKRIQEKQEKEHKDKRDPLTFKSPQLSVEQMRARQLTEKEIGDAEEEKKIEQRRINFRYGPDAGKESEYEKYLELNKRTPDDLKKEILQTYEAFRGVAQRFEVAYKEANVLAYTDTNFDYSGSYRDIFKRLPDFISRVTKQGIGSIFGITVGNFKKTKVRDSELKAEELVLFLRRGINLFNITPFNFLSKKNDMEKASVLMTEIMNEYEKRKKILNTIPKEIQKSLDSNLRRKDTREFLNWLETYFPTEKENFIKDIISDISNKSSIDSRFSIMSLTRMKTYSEIYYKAQRTIGFELRQHMEGKVRRAIISDLRKEVEAYSEAKIDKTIEILNALHSSGQEDTSEFEKFLFATFKIDLRGIFQFCGLTIKNQQDSNLSIIDFKRTFIENFRKSLIFIKSNNLLLVNIISNFIDKYAPGGGRADRKGLSAIPSNKIHELSNEHIRSLVVESLPNFQENKYNKAYVYPSFEGAGRIVMETGRLSPNNTIDMILNIMPFIPKEFISSLIKGAFKGYVDSGGKSDYLHEGTDLTPNQVFLELTDLKDNNNITVIKTLLELLKRSNKYTPDNFNNYFKSSYQSLKNIVRFFKSNYAGFADLAEDEVSGILTTVFKHPDYIDRDGSKFNSFIKFLHDSASKVNKKDLLTIINSKNYINYSKVAISRKLINVVSMIRSLGGLKGIIEKYKEAIDGMKESGFVSKEFDKNINFAIRLFNSNQEVNPSHPQYQKIFDTLSSIETDLETIEMGEAMGDLLKDYQKKDSRLFQLNFEINQNLRFRVLKDRDPRTLRIGIETNCCQRIGGVGEEAAKQSFANPLAGVVILEWLDEGDWKILTQSYFHYVPAKNGYILDNVESNRRNCIDSSVDLEAAYALLADKMKSEFKVSYFLAGKGYSKISDNKFKTHSMSGGDPRFFAELKGKKSSNYSDFSTRSSIDLLAPKFKLDIEKQKLLNPQTKKAFNVILDNFFKLSSL